MHHYVPLSHYMSPSSRRIVQRCLSIPTAADDLPQMLNVLATAGKHSFLGLLVGYIAFCALWLPFWALTFLITEWGLYALFVGTVFFVGRIIIRLLAFPGSSPRVSGEIEKEFAKYSVRMLQTAVNTVIELASAIGKLDPAAKNNNFYEISTAWKRVQSYRDRVMGMYYEVLVFIYQETAPPGVCPEAAATNNNNSQLNGFGNNKLSGDVGNLSDVTPEAQADGRRLMGSLGKVLIEINALERHGSTLLNNSGRFVPQDAMNDQVKQSAQSLLQVAMELKNLLPGLAIEAATNESDDFDDEDEDVTMDSVRRRLEKEGGGSTWDAISAAAGSILPMLDPPPHKSIFGLDVLRGTVLSRYKGASQLWVRRPAGAGRIDGFHIPASQNWDPASGRNRKAVLYCNPNAGLIEVATGISLASGNCTQVQGSDGEEACWTDYYTQKGYDVYLFNYAGFGRSHGTASTGNTSRAAGCLGTCYRILRGAFVEFKPTPETLRTDAFAFGSHLINELGVDSLILHGESIGGMAAAGAGRGLTNMESTRDKVALLICDRTFANLQAIAQRLVGAWTAPAITSLVPLWNTDVAADFLAATCPKLVAQDHADAIIADSGSLKAGIALWKEVRRETSTKAIGYAMDAPVEYRVADWENVGVIESRLVPATSTLIQPPSWPTDKHITTRDGFHFAACARRIGKMSTQERKANRSRVNTASDEEQGFEVDHDGNSSSNNGSSQQQGNGETALVNAWKVLACCDGLCGSPLGAAVKQGNDWTLTWLCCTLTFGGQEVVSSAEKRSGTSSEQLTIAASDFDSRPNGYQTEENEMMVHPKPIPEVLATLKKLLAQSTSTEGNSDTSLSAVKHEISYCVGMLEYAVARLSASVGPSRQGLHFQDPTVGHLLNLHCGHNNQFSVGERAELTTLLEEVMSSRR